MDSSCDNKSSSNRLWQRILACLTQDWVPLLFDLYHALRRWWSQQQPEGMYQILDYETTLELVDRKGQTANFKKRQKVKFMQDHIIAFQDYAWGDGDIFADYQCSPGIVVDRYKDGDRWNILISLRETKSSGDITDFYIERTAKKGGMQTDEVFQTEIRHPTRRLKVDVIFPKARRCQRAVLEERSRHRSRVLGPEHFTNLPDGRQRLTWETRKIRQFEIYTIKWRW